MNSSRYAPKSVPVVKKTPNYATKKEVDVHALAEQVAINTLQTQSLKMKVKELKEENETLKEENESQNTLIMNLMLQIEDLVTEDIGLQSQIDG